MLHVYEFEIFEKAGLFVALPYDFDGGTQGATFADACEMAAEWLQVECEYRAIHDEPFPKQTFGNLPKMAVKLLLSRSMPTKTLFAKLTRRARPKCSALPRAVFRRWSRQISGKLLGMVALFG